MLRRMIYVTFEKEGIHAYPAAPDAVSYLRRPHRHLFKFRVAIEVKHDGREIEFHLFKRELMGLYEGGTIALDDQSCEMIADGLRGYLTEHYPGRRLTIEVSEDGENGCIVEHEEAA